MRLLVAGDFRWNSGSSHVIREYVKHAPSAGIEVAVSGELGSRDEPITRELPYCHDLGWATHLLVVFEGNPFLTEEDLERIERKIPRSRRAVVDADGHWAAAIRVGDDCNTWPVGLDTWHRQIRDVADLILQPALISPSPGAVEFPYFGMPTTETTFVEDPSPCVAKDVQYIGSNWFRFPALVEVFTAARSVLGDAAQLCVRGRYWDGGVRRGYERATTVDREILNRLRVDVQPPVPFGKVVAHMSTAVVTPVLVRPLLSTLGFLTPRMLETVSASTIPVYRREDSYLERLYQDDGLLCLGAETTSAESVFRPGPAARAVVNGIRKRLQRDYSYTSVLRRLRELMT